MSKNDTDSQRCRIERQPAPIHPPQVRWLAEQAMAPDLFKATADGVARSVPETVDGRPTMEALLADARRSHEAPTDLAIERAIRTDRNASRRYCNLLSVMAQTSRRNAIAAYSGRPGEVPKRRVGAWELRVSAPGGLVPVLVLEQREPAPTPAAIEAVGAEGAIRLVLPEPVAEAIQLPLNENDARLAALHRLLTRTDTEIVLL